MPSRVRIREERRILMNSYDEPIRKRKRRKVEKSWRKTSCKEDADLKGREKRKKKGKEG